MIDRFLPDTHTSFIAIGEKAGMLRREWAGDRLKRVKHKALASTNVAARFSRFAPVSGSQKERAASARFQHGTSLHALVS